MQAEHGLGTVTRLTAAIDEKRLGDDLVNLCAHYVVARFSGGLDVDEAREIALDARAGCYESLSDDAIDTSEKVRVLIRSLEKHRKRVKREHQRLEQPHEQADAFPIAFTPSCEELVVQRNHLRAVVRLLFWLFPTALECQRDRDHDLLISHYRLDELGVERRLPPRLDRDWSEAAHAKAAYRARRRFSATLQELADFERAAAPDSRKALYDDVLKLILTRNGLETALYLLLEDFDWEL